MVDKDSSACMLVYVQKSEIAVSYEPVGEIPSIPTPILQSPSIPKLVPQSPTIPTPERQAVQTQVANGVAKPDRVMEEQVLFRAFSFDAISLNLIRGLPPFTHNEACKEWKVRRNQTNEIIFRRASTIINRAVRIWNISDDFGTVHFSLDINGELETVRGRILYLERTDDPQVVPIPNRVLVFVMAFCVGVLYNPIRFLGIEIRDINKTVLTLQKLFFQESQCRFFVCDSSLTMVDEVASDECFVK
jgi:hypothetical protein